MVAVIAAICLFGRIFDYRAISIVNQQAVKDSTAVSITVQESELMDSLHGKGVLLTPAEYTNNLVGYYNTLIAFLGLFFLVFTFGTYFYVKGMSKKEVREEAREILLDSASFKQEVIETLRGEFDDDFVSTENFDKYAHSTDEKIGLLKDDFEKMEMNGGQGKEGTVNPKKGKTKKA